MPLALAAVAVTGALAVARRYRIPARHVFLPMALVSLSALVLGLWLAWFGTTT